MHHQSVARPEDDLVVPFPLPRLPLGISARLESGFASIRGNDAPNSPSSPSVATEGDEGELGASFPLMDANPLSNLAEMPRGRRGSGNGTTRSSSGRATD